jgi:hypothetical protein
MAILILLAASAAGIAAIASLLRRPIPRILLGAFVLVAILPFPRAFVTDRTPLPLDHVLFTQPWMRPGLPPPYNPNLNDIATQILPWAKATRLAWKEGSLPLRDRWNGCGTPLAANSVSAAFSPLTFLGLLLPLAASYTLISAIKILLAAAGMWLWSRELGASARSAAFAGIAYGLSFSFTPPWLFYPQSSVLCLWPWMLFLLERLRDERGRGATIGALAALFAGIELAGHPETAVMGFLFAAIWIVARFLIGDLPRPARLLSALGIAASIAVGLTAFLLIPSVFAIAASGRIADAQRPYWTPLLSLLPHAPLWRALPTALFPHTLGNAISSPMLPFGGGSFPETGLGYFGIVGWAAAFLALRPGSPRPRAEWILWGLLACGWGASVGLWPLAEIVSYTPGIRFLFPLRFHSWEALAGPAIAALELDRLARDLSAGRRAALSAAIVPLTLVALAVGVFLRFRPAYAVIGGLPFQSRRLLVTCAVLAAVALLLAAFGRSPGVATTALTALCAAELLYQWRGISRPLYSPADLFPETPMIRFLPAQPGTFRVAGKGATLFPSTNVFAGLEDIRTHDAVERRDYLTFLDRTAGYPYEYFKKIRNLDAASLDFLNVRYALTGPGDPAPGTRWRLAYDGPDGRAFENSRFLERAFVPARVRLVGTRTRAREPLADANAAFSGELPAIFSNADWRGRAWVLSAREGETDGGMVEISDYRESTNAAAFAASVSSPEGWIVLSLVQDGGWTARHDGGEAVPLLRANGPFLAMRLPRGTHRIALRYSPPGFRAGLGLAGLTAAALGIAAGMRLRRLRGAAPSRPG